MKIGILLFMSNPNGWRNAKVIGGAEIITAEIINKIDDFYRYVIGTNQVIFLLEKYLIKAHLIKIYSLFEKTNIYKDIIFGLYYFLLSIIKSYKIRKDINIVYASTTNFSDIFPAKIVSRLINKPLITKYHISIYDSGSFMDIYNVLRSEKNGIVDSFIRACLAKFTIRIMKSAKLNIGTCKYVVDQLKNIGIHSNKLAVNYLGFDIKELDNIKNNLGPQDKIYNICYLGRIEKNKGVNDILQVLEYYNKIGIIKNAIIIGDGTYTNELKQLVKEKNLLNQVTFAGFVKGIEKYKLLMQSEYFLSPTYAKEGFGITIFEAAYFECKVIAYQNPIFDEVYAHIPNVTLCKTGVENLIKNLENNNYNNNLDLLKERFSLENSVNREIILLKNI